MPFIKHTSPLLRYGVAVLAVGVAFAIKLLLDPLIVQETPFLLVLACVLTTESFAMYSKPIAKPSLSWFSLAQAVFFMAG